MRDVIRTALRLSGWAGVVLLVPGFLLPGGVVVRTPIPSLVEHLIAFAALGFVFTLIARERPRRLFAAVALVGLAATLEAAQYLAPGRQPSLIDFMAGVLGVLGGWLGAEIVRALLSRFLDRQTDGQSPPSLDRKENARDGGPARAL